MIIYQATNKINGKSYIGQTLRSLSVRKREHKSHAFRWHSNTVFSKALRRYGIENFEWKVIYRAKNISELNLMEEFFIKSLKSLAASRGGYNVEFGGKNSPASELTKKKISNIKKQEKYIEIAKSNLPKNTNGSNNGRYKIVAIEALAYDFQDAKMSYKTLQYKYGISRPTILRKLKSYLGSSFSEIQRQRERILENRGRSLS